jgi:DNA-binding CsgD family transcriptional regulator
MGGTLTDSTHGLSESQRTCLRLVGRGMSSKEIAIETGLSPATVDTYVKAAMAKLGASNRRDAARLLTSIESQDLGSPASGLPGPRSVQHQSAVADGEGWSGWIAPPPLGGSRNELDAAGKTLAILKVAGLGAVMVLAIALLMAGALQTFR